MSENGFLCKKVIALPLPWQQSQRVFKESERMKVSERKLNKKKKKERERLKGSDKQALFKKRKGFCYSERLSG